MRECVIGAVLHRDTLTYCVRTDNVLGEPRQQTIATPEQAAALLLHECYLNRHDDPVIYLESGAMAGEVLDSIYEARKREGIESADEIVNGLSPALSLAEGGIRFADRRSELHHNFQALARKSLAVPAAYNEQVRAFAQDTHDGKIFFPHVADVAERLGRYPALAVAAVLAAIEVPQQAPSEAGKITAYDPYKKIQ